ncbi:uncharacterized protein LOC125648140 [Ostrea edulis]|uniref:uncharacterized protein LOC125648140 n=1 Tax=Ostrea edulis TaxID=37623 RepID=UPI00209628C2|nr:uncharacterized protein LOC125648140 [Ostrea edulis]XP_055996382.1 uncharacterized protein LOC125648140 [Ostrea edulis]
MEDIEDILPNNCTIPINPCRETTFLTSASSEYERESLREVPSHHRISGGGHYNTPSPAPKGEEKEPRSISQLINRREDSFSSKEETELGNLRSATSRSSGNSRNSVPTLSESRQSGISFGNVFEKGLFHSKIIPNDSKFPYRLQLPNVKIKEEEENTKRQKFYCVIVTVVLAVFIVGGAILAMVLAVNLAT